VFILLKLRSRAFNRRHVRLDFMDWSCFLDFCAVASRPAPFGNPLLFTLKKTYISLTVKRTFSFQFTLTLWTSAPANKNHPSNPLRPTPTQISLMDSTPKWRRVKWRHCPWSKGRVATTPLLNDTIPKMKHKAAWFFSLQANCANWATAAGRRILEPTFADRGVSRGQRGGSARLLILVF
jgi:hypothetical protein